jgi:hypothetical protein
VPQHTAQMIPLHCLSMPVRCDLVPALMLPLPGALDYASTRCVHTSVSASASVTRAYSQRPALMPVLADPESGAAPYVRTFACTTDVFFDDLPKELIEAYIASGEPASCGLRCSWCLWGM